MRNGLGTLGLRITWELLRDAHSQAPPQTSRGGAQHCFTKPTGDSDVSLVGEPLVTFKTVGSKTGSPEFKSHF